MWQKLKLYPKEDKYSSAAASSGSAAGLMTTAGDPTSRGDSRQGIERAFSLGNKTNTQQSLQLAKIDDEEDDQCIAPPATSTDSCYDYDLLYHNYGKEDFLMI